MRAGRLGAASALAVVVLLALGACAEEVPSEPAASPSTEQTEKPGEKEVDR